MKEKDGGGFVRTLVAIADGGHSGLLEVRAQPVTTLLYFAAGRLVFAEEGTLGETLGRILLREGKLTPPQYSAIIDRMTAAIFESEQMRFGEAAVALGFLSPQEVNDALGHQVQRKLAGCFQYQQFELGFDRSPEPLRAVAHFPCAVPPLVREGIARHWGPDRCSVVLEPHRAETLRVDAARVGELGLPATSSRFVRQFDGQTLARAMEGDGTLDEVVRLQLLTALVLTRSVVFDRAAPEPSSEERALEPEREAAPLPRSGQPVPEPDAPEPAASEPTASEPPAPEPAATGASARSAAQLLAQRLAARRKEPPRRRSAPPPDLQKQRLLAERSFAEGLRDVRYEAWAAAAKKLRKAAELEPDLVEYELYAAWAEWRADPPSDEKGIERARAHLWDLAEGALKRNRENAFGWHVRAQLAVLEGDEERALKRFRSALRLDPEDREAERWVRLLAGRLKKK
ncbi:MAG: hypothetical protein CMN30_17725 [Sandaracinus sp.]|nr:hypothetical protein [Sandaracinus sp.]